MIRIEELMDWSNIFLRDVMLGFHEAEVIHKLLDCRSAIIVSVVCRPEKALQIIQTDLDVLN